MNDTSDLIRLLATDLPRVRRLRPPLLRAGAWLGMAAVVLGLVTFTQGIRPNFFERMHETVFLTSMVASMLTGVLATCAAFLVSLPGRSRLWMALPLPSLAVWLSTIGYQCFADWVPVPPHAVTPEAAASCLATLVLTGLPLSVAFLIMLRHAAVLDPAPVTIMGSLAVSALTAATLSMLHPLDATAMILVWNFGTGIMIFGAAMLLSRR